MAARPRRRTAITVLVLAGVAVALVVVATVSTSVTSALTNTFYSVSATPPQVGTRIVAPEQSKAQKALTALELTDDQRAATDWLAHQPTAYWLTPEQDPLGVAGETVADLVAQAREEDETLALVVYGLPGRDCGNHSAGGLSEADYPRWVGEIAAALEDSGDVETIVVLEPDSLALAPECGNLGDRARQLGGAVDLLTSPNTWIYLDGGHSNWLSVDEMANLLGQTGLLGAVRGVATNVSNYQDTYAEFQYAHALSERLGGIHAVIDTSRNGAASAGSEWCNPEGQRVGDVAGTYGDDVVDTNLWIKPPGESDGPCNGGPDAGVWWPEGAVALTDGRR